MVQFATEKCFYSAYEKIVPCFFSSKMSSFSVNKIAVVLPLSPEK